VLAVLLAWNIPLKDAAHALSLSRAASGAWRCSADAAHPLAIVDYAHTPMPRQGAARGAPALSRTAAGGIRLRRRPRCRQASAHGRIAAELADDIIVTDDNPRSEDPRGSWRTSSPVWRRARRS